MPAVERFAREVASHSMGWDGSTSSLEESESEELSIVSIGVVASSTSVILDGSEEFVVVNSLVLSRANRL